MDTKILSLNRKLIGNFLITCFLLVSLQTYSQKGNISGLIVDSATEQPVEYATISLLDNVTHKTITGSISNAQGLFKIQIVKTGNVSILIEAIGFLPFQLSFQLLDKSKSHDMGKIRLKQKTSDLQGVTIIGGQKLIENRIDKMVFNAENDLTSQGGVVTDILKKFHRYPWM